MDPVRDPTECDDDRDDRGWGYQGSELFVMGSSYDVTGCSGMFWDVLQF